MANPKNNMSKKLRERELIEEFFAICSDYDDYQFSEYDENPDLIYKKDSVETGFESVIVSEDQAQIECRFDANKCQLSIPNLTGDKKVIQQATEVLIRNLFKHIRKYSIPTVLVFSVIDNKIDLIELAGSFRLPEFSQYNIKDYYLANKDSFVKLSENELSQG